MVAVGETGGGRDFRVRPEVLRGYATTVRGQGGSLAGVGGDLAAVSVEPAWFGRLPQSGHLADRYGAHHQAELAGVAELLKVLLAVAAALEATAGAYSGVDVAAADALRGVRLSQGPMPSRSPNARPTPTPTPGPTPPTATGIAEAIR